MSDAFPNPDAELLARCRKGDRAALNVLFTRFEEPVFRFIQRFWADPDVAQDLMQETFLRILKSIKSWQPRAKFSTWVFQIARNLCVDWGRSRRTAATVNPDTELAGEGAPFLESIPDPGDTDPSAPLTGEELRAEVMRALGQIADAKREAIILRFFHNVPYAEMSEICGAPEGTLKFRVHDGLKDIERIVGPRIGQAVEDMVRQGSRA